MGRLRSRCAGAAEFRNKMENHLNFLINSDRDRSITEKRHIEAYKRSLGIVIQYAEESDRRDELLDALWSVVPTPPAYEKMTKSAVLCSKAGIGPEATPETWHLYCGNGESCTTPNYGFFREPEWDDDDCAEYCIDPEGFKPHKHLFVRLLAYRATVLEIPDAKSGLIRAFEPLIGGLVAQYRKEGWFALGREAYEESVPAMLSASLEKAIEDFDFFYRKELRVGPCRVNMEEMPYRRRGSIIDDIELPFTVFVHARLKNEMLGIVGRPSGRNPNRYFGPLVAEEYDGLLLLLEDAVSVLGVKESQVRRRIKQGDLRAWKADQFVAEFNREGSEEVVLTDRTGQLLRLTRRSVYWVIDADSVNSLKKRCGKDGKYVLHPRGRPTKEKKQQRDGASASRPSAAGPAETFGIPPYKPPALGVCVVRTEDRETA